MKPTQAPAAEAPHESGELHRRVNKIMEAGLLRPVPRAGLIVFLQCRQWADFKKCRFTVSIRTLARSCRISKSPAQRGLKSLADAGVLREHKSPSTQYRVFEIIAPKAPQMAHPRDDRGKKSPWKKGDETQQGTGKETSWD